MKHWKPALLLLTALLAAGCSTIRTAPPNWVSNPKAVYPENRFLVAVGAGDTRRAAENAAAANLSRIFEARIEAEERLHDQTTETLSTIEQTSEYSADINILSTQTLFNIQHAEAWQDEQGRLHAVAYLDRRDTAAVYQGKIENQTAQINFLLQQARQTDNAFQHYAALRRAVQLARTNRILLDQLSIIHPATAGRLEPPYSLSTLNQNFAAAAARIPVQISIHGNGAEQLAAGLEEVITGYGFAVGTPAAMQITGSLLIQDTGKQDAGYRFVRYEMVLQFRDQHGTVFSTLTEKGREAHVSIKEAELRALRTLEQTVKTRAPAYLDAYFTSLIQKK